MVHTMPTKYFLGFSLQVRPYAEVAAFLLTHFKDKEAALEPLAQIRPFSSPAGLELGLLPDSPFSAALKLTIDRRVPAAGNCAHKQFLREKYAIARFFDRSEAAAGSGAAAVRTGGVLSAGLGSLALAAVDDWVSACLRLVPATAGPTDGDAAVAPPCKDALHALAAKVDKAVGSAEKPRVSVVPGAPHLTLADVALWDLFTAQRDAVASDARFAALENFGRWLSATGAVRALATAEAYVNATLATLPMLHVVKIAAAKAVAVALGGTATARGVYHALEKPRDATHGDLAVPLPKLRLAGNPVALCKAAAEAVRPGGFVAGAKAAGPFLNLSLDRHAVAAATLRQISEQGVDYGRNADGLGQVAVAEYSSPNIAKPFHAGHLRSAIIGNFLKQLLRRSGFRVVGLNYLGDWGKQYGLLGVGYKRYGDDAALEADPIKHLYDVYVKINADARENEAIHDEAREFFAQMEAGDSDALRQWRRFRELSIEKYIDLYERLNIRFDEYSGESMYAGDMTWVLQQLRDCRLLEESEGAQVVRLEAQKAGTALITKKDGTTLYLTRDIAAAISRKKKYDFDVMLYVVGTQQALHFQQLFALLRLMGHDWATQCRHVNFGLIKSEGGDQMSTRRGTVVFLQDILDQTRDEMHDVMRRNEAKYAQVENPDYVADQVGISAIIVQDMSSRRILNYCFDWARMLSFEGDTGPYLQYAHARLASVERTADEMGLGSVTADACDFARLSEPAAIELSLLLAEWPDVVREALRASEPCTVVSYLMRVSHAVSAAWDVLWVKGQEPELAKPRLVLYRAARTVIRSAFDLVGLRPLERM